MRRNKGLLITMIIIIALLIIAIVGLVLWKFVFSKKGNTTNSGQIIDNTPQPEVYPIEVGDYVDYSPDKAAKYLLTEATSGSSDNVATGIDQEEVKWRILSINDDGTVDIISEEPIEVEAYFKGATRL